MSAFLTWDGGQMLWDCTINEQHEGTVEITRFPVESGVDINDHVRQAPTTVTLECFISNTPTEDLGRGGVVKQMPVMVETYQAPLGPSIGSAVAALTGSAPVQVNFNVLTFDSPFDSVADALQILDGLQGDPVAGTSATILKVVTSKRDYEGMILESWKLTRGAAEGSGGAVSMTFRRLHLVTSKVVTAPLPTEARGQKAKQAGGGKKDAKDPVKKQSDLKAAVNFLKSKFGP